LAKTGRLKAGLISAINNGSDYADRLNLIVTDMRSIENYLNDNVNLSRLAYFRGCAINACHLVQKSNLHHYVDIIGPDGFDQAYEVNYLNDFYKLLIKADRENHALLANLSEAMGSVYVGLAENSDLADEKKQRLGEVFFASIPEKTSIDNKENNADVMHLSMGNI